MFLRVLFASIILFTSMTSYGQTQQQLDAAMEDWASVLETYVDETGRTNFAALAKNPEALKRVVDFVSTASPTATPELFKSSESQMAYYINSYNALAMYGVISEGIPSGFTSFLKRARFFKFRDVVVGNEETNLYDYENKVIRPLGENRAHFALNCMVKDCPRLPQVPFTEQDLEQQLDQAAWGFFGNKKHFYLDDKKKVAYVSEILDFYTEDFVESGKAKDLGPYINKYLQSPIPEGYKIKFIDYDWRINAQP